MGYSMWGYGRDGKHRGGSDVEGLHGLEREVRQWWELEILQLFQVQAGVAIHVPSYDASAYA